MMIKKLPKYLTSCPNIYISFLKYSVQARHKAIEQVGVLEKKLYMYTSIFMSKDASYQIS